MNTGGAIGDLIIGLTGLIIGGPIAELEGLLPNGGVTGEPFLPLINGTIRLLNVYCNNCTWFGGNGGTAGKGTQLAQWQKVLNS